ncbi:response regulator [Rheinheimera baltica]|uniref:response regulator n=1 Tax=Rheinheimera baltica TaxID=67576 RepID=UPI00040AB11F|nr:response regulator [Rheinheimera baltica]
MMLFTGLWYHFDSKAQQRLQLEQVTATLQLSIRPLLNNNDADLVRAQLNLMRFVSALPLRSIAVYSREHRLELSTELPDSLKHFSPEKPVSDFSMQPFDEGVLVLKPFSNTTKWPDLGESAIPDQYYLLLLFEKVTSHSVWLIPVILMGVLGGIVLILFQNNLAQLFQRQHTDVSLLVHKLSQLRGGQNNVNVNEDLVPELAALKPAINALAAYHQDTVFAAKQLSEQQQQKIDNAEQENVLLQQQYLSVQQQNVAIQQTVQNRLQVLMQLQQQQAELEYSDYLQALNAQLELFQLEFASQGVVNNRLKLTDFVYELLPKLTAWSNDKHIELQIFEGADNLRYQVEVPEQPLALLLQSLMQIASRAPGITELILRVELNVVGLNATLHISITGSGEGITARTRQLLTGNDTRPLQWHESDIGFFIVSKRLLNAELSIQSLEGLGCTIALSLPISTVQLDAPIPVKRALYFGSQHGDLTERTRAIEPLVSSILKCSDIADFSLKYNKLAFDFALVLLPEPADLMQWRTLLDELREHCPLYCYALPSQIAVWREALQQTVYQTPFCLGSIQPSTTREEKQPRLLVVDDNTTNLSFVQVLLKDHPIELHTASCGTAALQMCQQRNFDVVLLDIQLPDISGTEVARRLRQLSEYQTTPILAFTAHALEEEMHSFLQAGMNDVIIKPLDVAKLSQILEWCSRSKTNDVNQ